MTSKKPPLLLLAVVIGVRICTAQNPPTNTSTNPDTTTASPTDTAPATDTAPPATTPPRPQFFAGTITSITNDQITISRTLVGHQPDTRSFQLTPKTKMNKNNCKPNTKVTVRYQHLPEGDVALQVLVHPPSKPAIKHP